MEYNESWQTCIQHYEAQKQREMWQDHAEAMVRLIERMRLDPTLNHTRRLISHQWLRIGPNINDPSYKPSVWIGSRRPNYYWFGVGSFGTQNRITVSADRVIPMLKRYLENLVYLDPEFKHYAPTEMVDTITDEDGIETIEFNAAQLASELGIDPWSQDYLNQKFDTIPLFDLVPVLAEDLIEQNNELRDFTGKLQSIMESIREIESAEQTVDEMMQRIERISAIIDAGLARYRILESGSADDDQPQKHKTPAPYYLEEVMPPDTMPLEPVHSEPSRSVSTSPQDMSAQDTASSAASERAASDNAAEESVSDMDEFPPPPHKPESGTARQDTARQDTARQDQDTAHQDTAHPNAARPHPAAAPGSENLNGTH